MHRHPHCPGVGAVSKVNCLNFTLQADCGDEVYLRTFDEALKKVEPQSGQPFL
ncbi:hypothetical protein HXY32_00765 [Candidatus Bathyarchaeota archaeon]|nr:hypothetical protein [Candidatus Bathyarchaeota archaeon]